MRRGSSLLGVAVVAGAQQVAGAEQLGARVVADGRLAHEQALEHQQPDRLAAAGEPRLRRPAPARDVDRAGVEPLGGLACPRHVEPAGQLGVDLQKLNGA